MRATSNIQWKYKRKDKRKEVWVVCDYALGGQNIDCLNQNIDDLNHVNPNETVAQ